MKLTLLYTVMLFLFYSNCTNLFAQPSDDKWWPKNDRGNRYEGLYTKNVSRNTAHLTLVSLRRTFETYRFDAGHILNVAFYNPGGESFRMIARELIEEDIYWMQTDASKFTLQQNKWNIFTPWEVDRVLSKILLDKSNLGVLVELGEKNSNRYLPVDIYLGENPLSQRKYVAHLYSSERTERGSYEFFAYNQNQLGESLGPTRSLGPKTPGTVFPLVFLLEDFGEYEGWVYVKVTMDLSNGKQFTDFFYFYHKVS